MYRINIFSLSALEVLCIEIIVVLHWWVYVPNVSVMWIVRIVNESFGGFPVSYYSSWIISEWIVREVLVAENVIFAWCGRIRSAWVDEHGWVHVISDPLFVEFQGLLKLCWWFADTEQWQKSLSEGVYIVIKVLLTSSVFIQGDLFFSSQKAS